MPGRTRGRAHGRGRTLWQPRHAFVLADDVPERVPASDFTSGARGPLFLLIGLVADPPGGTGTPQAAVARTVAATTAVAFSVCFAVVCLIPTDVHDVAVAVAVTATVTIAVVVIIVVILLVARGAGFGVTAAQLLLLVGKVQAHASAGERAQAVTSRWAAPLRCTMRARVRTHACHGFEPNHT